jgi:predicted DsbA family dithiol-disulfide isomerase
VRRSATGCSMLQADDLLANKMSISTTDRKQGTPMNQLLPILWFSDVLCVFAYAANARIEQLRAEFSEQVSITQHFMSVYGDVPRRMDRVGKTAAEYGANVLDIASRFEHIEVHEELFQGAYPVSSMPAHLYLRAVSILEDEGLREGTFSSMMWDVRVSFFRDLVDISKREDLDTIAERHGVPVDEVTRLLETGRAHADLDRDARLQRDSEVNVSPCLLLNEGRQRLSGNVGYRVIEANVREVLRSPEGEMSWC